MQDYFYKISDNLFKQLVAQEILLLNLQGEESDFTRFNQSKIRQSGLVFQEFLSIELLKGNKHASGSLTLSKDLQEDLQCIKSMLGSLRDLIKEVPDDPHLLFNTKLQNSEYLGEATEYESEHIIAEICKNACKQDLVGFLACGRIHQGFANSLGQKNWFEADCFNFDWSLYHRADKAVKSQFAGTKWDQNKFSQILSQNQNHLANLKPQAKTIKPGSYRVYLAPAAHAEIISLLTWGGFSHKALATKTSPLQKLFEKKATFSPKFGLYQDNTHSMAPNFDSMGYVYTQDCGIIKAGNFSHALISPRTAKEFDLVPNNPGSETPKNIVLEGATLEPEAILEKLDTGIYISNLWYLNYSDHSNARITGMTRFACFWVENGEIKAPIEVMRFDVSVYDIFGKGLIDLCSESELLLSNSSYHKRNTSSLNLPGALINDFMLTL
ncbi:MAG: metallopeptidase TldD-related protein [Oligoflexales bacterium]